MRLPEASDDAGHASVHVLTTPLRQPLRAASSVFRTTRWLRNDHRAGFFLCGRSSAGSGVRNISRTLSTKRVVAVVAWTSCDDAKEGRAALDERSRQAGADAWSAALTPLRARGEWDGRTPFRPNSASVAGDGREVASLTCARVRPRSMVDFYFRSFPALARQVCGPDSPMVAGLGFGGAVPLRDAFTITFWPTSHDVEAFAFGSSAHGAVQRRSVTEDWLSQSLFARFVVSDHAGTWAEGDPLAATSRTVPL